MPAVYYSPHTGTNVLAVGVGLAAAADYAIATEGADIKLSELAVVALDHLWWALL